MPARLKTTPTSMDRALARKARVGAEAASNARPSAEDANRELARKIDRELEALDARADRLLVECRS